MVSGRGGAYQRAARPRRKPREPQDGARVRVTALARGGRLPTANRFGHGNTPDCAVAGGPARDRVNMGPGRIIPDRGCPKATPAPSGRHASQAEPSTSLGHDDQPLSETPPAMRRGPTRWVGACGRTPDHPLGGLRGQSSRCTFSIRSWRSCASMDMVAMGRASRRLRPIGSKVSSQKP